MLDNCLCYVLEVVKVVCVVWFVYLLLLVCILVIDWVEGGMIVDEVVEIVCQLYVYGVDVIDVFFGEVILVQKLVYGCMFQVLFVDCICNEVGVLIIVVGVIIEVDQVNGIIVFGCVDLCVLLCLLLVDLVWLLYESVCQGWCEVSWLFVYQWGCDQLECSLFGICC